VACGRAQIIEEKTYEREGASHGKGNMGRLGEHHRRGLVGVPHLSIINNHEQKERKQGIIGTKVIDLDSGLPLWQ